MFTCIKTSSNRPFVILAHEHHRDEYYAELLKSLILYILLIQYYWYKFTLNAIVKLKRILRVKIIG